MDIEDCQFRKWFYTRNICSIDWSCKFCPSMHQRTIFICMITYKIAKSIQRSSWFCVEKYILVNKMTNCILSRTINISHQCFIYFQIIGKGYKTSNMTQKCFLFSSTTTQSWWFMVGSLWILTISSFRTVLYWVWPCWTLISMSFRNVTNSFFLNGTSIRFLVLIYQWKYYHVQHSHETWHCISSYSILKGHHHYFQCVFQCIYLKYYWALGIRLCTLLHAKHNLHSLFLQFCTQNQQTEILFCMHVPLLLLYVFFWNECINNFGTTKQTNHCCEMMQHMNFNKHHSIAGCSVNGRSECVDKNAMNLSNNQRSSLLNSSLFSQASSNKVSSIVLTYPARHSSPIQFLRLLNCPCNNTKQIRVSKTPLRLWAFFTTRVVLCLFWIWKITTGKMCARQIHVTLFWKSFPNRK